MDQKIFSLGLSVEATSLYFILDDLTLHDQDLSPEVIRRRWSGTEDALDAAFAELVAHKVAAGSPRAPILRPAAAWTGAAAG